MQLHTRFAQPVLACLSMLNVSCVGQSEEQPLSDDASDTLQETSNPDFVFNADTDYAVTLVNARGEEYCQGSLIAPNVIMTASHCIVSCAANGMRVRHRGSTTKTVRVMSTLTDAFTQRSIADFCRSCADDPDWPCEVLPEAISILDQKEETESGREGVLNHDFALFRLATDITAANTRFPPISLDGPNAEFQLVLGATSNRTRLVSTTWRANDGPVFRAAPKGCHGDSGGGASQLVHGQRALIGVISSVTYPDNGSCAQATEMSFVRISIPMTTDMLTMATGVTPLRDGRLLYPRGR